MFERLRIGLIGFGAVARVHLDAYRDLASIEVVAVTDSNPDRLALAQREFGLRGYATISDMLADARIDVACVLTPPAAHEEAVVECADRGVHVLCEKPLALRIDACERMIAACRVNDVRLCYGASYRYLPALMKAQTLIDSGALGDILVLREHVLDGRGPGGRDTLSIAHYPEGGPGGSGFGLCDHGIHLVDAFSWLQHSHVTEVWGRGNISGAPQRPEFAHLQYANGAIGHLLYEDGTFSTELPQEGVFGWGRGWSVGGGDQNQPRPGSWHAHPSCIHVHGTRGSLRIFYYANQLFLRDEAGVCQVAVQDRPVPANFSLQLDAFAQAIRDGRESPVPGEVGLEAWRTILGVYASMGAPSRESVILTSVSNT